MKFRKVFFSFPLFLMLALSFSVMGKPTIAVFIDSPIVNPGSGEPPSIHVSGQGSDETMIVDVHVALLSPDGTIYEYPNWNTDLKPWLPSFQLKSGVKVNPIPLTDLKNLPFELTPGNWRLAGAITKPGTLEFLSLDIQSFLVTDQSTNAEGGLRIGNLTVSEFRSAISTLPASTPTISSTRSASGTFIQLCPNQSFGDTGDELMSQFLDKQTIDQCEMITTNDIDPGEDPGKDPNTCADALSLNAGEKLELVSDQAGSIDVPLSPGSGPSMEFFYFAQLPETFFQTEARYTFSGTGGPHIGSFSTSATLAPLTVTAPDLLSGTAILNPGAPLDVRWNGQGGQGTVFVTLTAVGLNFDLESPSNATTDTRTIHCRFQDDGNGTIPGELIEKLTDGLASSPPFSTPIVMSVYRHRATFFNTNNNELDYGMYTLISGESGSLQLP